MTGALIQWLRDRLEIIDDAPEVEALAKTVDDNGGVYFVPAFSGLFAPHWRDDARGVIVGLTAYANQGHIARAALEAAAWQSKRGRRRRERRRRRAVRRAARRRRHDRQRAADAVPGRRARRAGDPPEVTETTALGAAYAAGLAVGFWEDQDELKERWAEDKRWEPRMDADERERGLRALAEGGRALARLGGRRLDVVPR